MEDNLSKLWVIFQRDTQTMIIKSKSFVWKIVAKEITLMEKKDRYNMKRSDNNSVLAEAGKNVSIFIKGQFGNEVATAINRLKW